MSDRPAMPETDLIKRLNRRIDTWKHNSDRARVSVPLRELRAAAAALSEKEKRIAEMEASDKDWCRLHQRVIMERAGAIQRAEAAEAQLATALADKAKMEGDVRELLRMIDKAQSQPSYASIYGIYHPGSPMASQVEKVRDYLTVKAEGGEDD